MTHHPGQLVPAPPTANVESVRLADQLERAVRGGAWHGPALLQAIEGVDVALATARPIAGAHSIEEVVWHAAFWIDVAHQRVAGVPATPLAPEGDWPREAEVAHERWRATRGRLEESYRRLHAAVLALADERLDDPVAGADPTLRGMLLGVLQHTAYHAGQIALLRKAGGGTSQ